MSLETREDKKERGDVLGGRERDGEVGEEREELGVGPEGRDGHAGVMGKGRGHWRGGEKGGGERWQGTTDGNISQWRRVGEPV